MAFYTRSLFSAFVLAAFINAPVAFSQDIIVPHVQGELTLKAVPEKVLVQDWAIVDDLNALGISVAGVPSSAVPGYMKNMVSDDIEKIGSLFEPDFEAIAAAQPDLYIIGGRSRTAYDTAKDIVPTIDLSVDNGSIIDGLKANMITLGNIFGKQQKAVELNAAIDAKVAEVKAAAEGKGRAMVLVTNAGKLGVYGPNSRVSWIYHEIGMPSALPTTKDGDHGGDAVSFEFLRETNPDWVFVVDRDAGVSESTGAAAAVLDNELFNQTNAAKEGQIVYLDPHAAYITMNSYTGVMMMLDQVLSGFQK